jgi:hypothetical protein
LKLLPVWQEFLFLTMSHPVLNQLSKIYLLFRVWSLDVVLGTLMVGAFIVELLDVSPSPWWWFILASTVWIIYTTDHLLDGYKGKNTQPVIYRHNYHFKHKLVLFIMMIVLSGITLGVGITCLHAEIVLKGILLFTIILLYFLIVHFIQKQNHFFNQKELLIALAYIAGITLAPMVWNNNPLTTHQIITIIVLVLLAWAEGVLASWFDYNNDLHDGHSSFTTTFGKNITKYFLITLHVIIFLLLKANIFFTEDWMQFSSIIIEAVMNLGLLLMLLNPKIMEKNERYRIFGEMIFWIPGIIIFAG